METTWQDPFIERLYEVTAARTILTAVETTEEGRFTRIAAQVVQRQNARTMKAANAALVKAEKEGLPLPPSVDTAVRSLYYWNESKGLVLHWGKDADGVMQSRPVPVPTFSFGQGVPPSSTANVEVLLMFVRHVGLVLRQRATFVLADFGTLLEPRPGDVRHDVVRALKDMALDLKEAQINLIMVGADWPSIPSLKDDVRVMRLPLPDVAALRQRLAQFEERMPAEGIETDLDDAKRDEIVQTLRGLSEQEVDRAIMLAVRRNRGLTAAVVPTLLEEKRSLIRASGALEYIHPRPASDAGGYRYVAETLVKARRSWRRRWSERGLQLKGVLFVGIAGAGKDYWASISGSIMGLPVLRLDIGSAMGEGGGVIGSAESAVSRALGIADAIGGILVISEFEKVVTGVQSSAKTDGGTTSRAISKLLVWMQEQTSCFIIATANDITHVDPEQLRGGRFDEKLFFDLPPADDIAAIMGVHVRARKGDVDWFDIPACAAAAAAKGFVAAEVEVAVKQAMLTAAARFDDAADAALEAGEPEPPISDFRPTTADLLAAIAGYTPLSEMNSDVVNGQRTWASKYGFQGAPKRDRTAPNAAFDDAAVRGWGGDDLNLAGLTE